MRGFAFAATTNTSDWHQPFYVYANGAYLQWWPPDDQVILGMSPDAITWSDYGAHTIRYPAGRTTANAPYFQASSNDGSGYVTLISPGLIDIMVPASVMRGFGPGELNVGMRFERASDSRTSTIFVGRLPVINGVV